MDNFNQLLQQLYFQVGNDEPLRNRKFLNPLSPELMRMLITPLGLTQSSLTIYYPISRYNEFDPVPISYYVTPETSALQLIETIRNVYKRPVDQSTIRAYMQKFSAHQMFLNKPNVTLKDLMFSAIYPTAIVPYKEGYLLKLNS